MTNATVLELIQGDKGSPTRRLSLADVGSTGDVVLRLGGSVLAAGEQVVSWTEHNIRRDGQKRTSSSRKNSVVRLSYDLRNGTAASLTNLQSQIYRFFEDAGLFEEEFQGEPIWIKYCLWGGTSLPAPVIGQYYQYLQVFAGEPKWPDALHNLQVSDGNILDVSADLTCAPLAEGLRQQVFTGLGQLEVGVDGILVTDAITNLFTNPSFGHTSWDNDWTVSDSSLEAKHETRLTFSRSLGSAARLINTDTGNDRQFTQTLTLTAAAYVVSCHAKKLDASAVTSDDLEMVLQGAARTTSFVSVGDGWYLCYAVATAALSSSTHGVEIKAGKSVVIDDLQIELSSGNMFQQNPSPYCSGHLIGCSWSGTAHASSSTRANGRYKIDLSNELASEFTLSLWITPKWSSDWVVVTLYPWIYKIDNNNYIFVGADTSNNQFYITKYLDGSGHSTYGGGSNFPIAYGDHIHLVAVQEEETLRLYINGIMYASVSVAGVMKSDGTLDIGSNLGSGQWINADIDGLKIWDTALSATEVAEIYNSELATKNSGQSVGQIPVLWTISGDSQLDAVDGVLSSAAKDNWGIVVGVPGDVPAITEWQLDPVASPSRVFWLGLKSVETPFTPANTLWLDFDTTADVGNSSGDGYDTDTTSGSGSDSSEFEKSLLDEIKDLQGVYQVLARFKVTGAAASVRPFLRLGSSNHIYFGAVNVAANASFLFRDFGQMIIKWPMDDPYRVRVGLEATETDAAAITNQLDFIQLMPAPWCRVECEDASIAAAAGDTLIIRDDRAWMTDASDEDSQLYHFYWRGRPVHVRPHRYNYVFVLQGEEGVAYPVADTVGVAAFVTPRYVVMGGPRG